MKRVLGISVTLTFVICAVVTTAIVEGSDKGTVTYTKDIAPILNDNCVSCHRPGEVAPMSLMSYKEVRPWAKSIREQVVNRIMPPWFADPKFGEFSNDCRLSDAQINTIKAWVEAGSPEGNRADLAELPKFTQGWTIGKPDVVLSMVKEFSIPAEGSVPYQNFVVPTNFTEDRYVQFAEIRQGDRRHVHHIIINVRYPNSSRGSRSGQAVSNLDERPDRGEDSDGRLVGWAPGEAPLILRPGQAKLIKKGSDLIFQVHYTTNGEPGTDRSSVGLIFSKVPVEKRVVTAGASARELNIPPGEPHYESSGSYTFKEDSHIENLHPHMHFRGKDFLYRLIYPDGTSKVLLFVPRYDFGWHLTYFFKEPIAATKGSRLECVAHHDNSERNKFNPDPTKLVTWGPQTWEEMMIGYFDYTRDKQNLRVNSETARKQ
ncbi:MAG TPA: cytochrome c [Blastocatellia bacterium]|nr:cytochrome c [Blastocatellia bacterium]